MLDLYEELRAIIGALDAAQIPYALVGGIAVSIYTSPRATEDVDLLVAAVDLDRCRAALDPLGYREISFPMDLAAGQVEIRRLVHLQGNDFLALALLLARGDPLTDILARRVAVGEGPERIYLAPLDGLRHLKRLHGSPQDLVDLAALGEEEGGV